MHLKAIDAELKRLLIIAQEDDDEDDPEEIEALKSLAASLKNGDSVRIVLAEDCAEPSSSGESVRNELRAVSLPAG
jgi:hypothetical protein